MQPPERAARGNYFQGHFVKVDDPNGEVESRNPGHLTMAPLKLPFCFEHVPESANAAKQAFPSWRRQPASARQAAVQRYRDALHNTAERLAWHITFEVGKPLWESRLEISETIAMIDFFLAHSVETTADVRVDGDAGDVGVVRYYPRGAMAVIPSSSQPIYSAHAHLVPALLHGNTVVMKAAKFAPLTGQFLAETAHEAGWPAGVFNVIQGDSEVGRRLCADPEIDGIFFTGHHETAAKIKKQILSDYWKSLVFESGGKNQMLLWEDGDFARAVPDALMAAFLTSGQRCTTTNRILVHAKFFDRFLEEFHELAKKTTVGHGLIDGTAAPFMGPLLSEATLENYLKYQGIAVREGCEEIMRGKSLEREQKGFYVSPSIHVVHRPDPKSVYQKTEAVGPNVALYRVNDLEEAIELLKQPSHGLAASVYTASREVFLRASEEARVGVFHLNRPTTHPAYRLAYGGLKKSGNARPMGRLAGYQCTYPVSSWESTESAATYPAALPTSKESERKA